jgi:hypothetical protein
MRSAGRQPRTRWAAIGDLSEEWDHAQNPGGLLVGYRGQRLVGWKDDRHALTVAGTRTGKGTSLIVPNLLSHPGSVVAIDPKGELARIAGHTIIVATLQRNQARQAIHATRRILRRHTAVER